MIEFVDTFALPICLMIIAIPQALILTYGFGNYLVITKLITSYSSHIYYSK